MGKRNSEKCEVKENAEHVILHCMNWKDGCYKMGFGKQDGNGIGLGYWEQRKGIISTRMALFKFLKATGLMGRI